MFAQCTKGEYHVVWVNGKEKHFDHCDDTSFPSIVQYAGAIAVGGMTISTKKPISFCYHEEECSS